MATAYTSGVAESYRRIAANPDDVYRYKAKGNLVAVVTDGTAILGLGDICPAAGVPVMEGKAVLFKKFENADAFPICLDTKDVDEIVETVYRITPTFGDIKLEDISASHCFEVEAKLKDLDGTLRDALVGADIFVGISTPNLVTPEMVQSMNHDAYVFAMANPTPEIMPGIAKQAGARIVDTDRSDFPNQINNVLVFPGLFRGALDVRAKEITENAKLAAAEAISTLISPEELNDEYIIPSVFDSRAAAAVAKAVANKAVKNGIARI